LETYEASVRSLGTVRRSLRHADILGESGMRIAVLEPSDPDRDFVCDAIRTLGHGLAEFLRPEGLLRALSTGDRFDLVLAAFDGDQNAALSGARNLRRVAGTSMPVLLMMRPEQLRSAETFVMDPANDFIMVPCEECEVVARIAASLKVTPSPHGFERLAFGRYLFDPRSRTVGFDGERAPLRRREFDLALFLFRNAGVVQSRDAIFKNLWFPGGIRPIGARMIDVHVAGIRRKLKLNFDIGNGVTLSTLYGLGYLLTLCDE
jgi:DNA-binding response OmpR family regulator